jgi:hypothetical protein
MAVAWSLRASSACRRIVRGIDRISRRMHGIKDFETGDDCLLRIAIGRVGRGIQLGDGIVLRAGDAYVELHLWNEHLAIPAQGPHLRWAAKLRRQFERSLRNLADHLNAHAEFKEVRALVMTPALADPQLERKLSRIVAMYGFEWTPATTRADAKNLAQRWVDNLWLWVLTWTFNPRSLKGRQFARNRQEFWISRNRFIALYSGADQPEPPQPCRSERRATARGIV